MIPVKIVDKIGRISDFSIDEDFYKFIVNQLHMDKIYVFGNKFITYMCDLYVKSLDKDYSFEINSLPPILSCDD